MKKEKLALFLLAFGILLGLTACSSSKKDTANDVIVYIPEFVSVSTQMKKLDSWCISGNNVYIRCRADSSGDQPPVILRATIDGGETEVLPEYQPPQPKSEEYDTGFQNFGMACSLQAGADGTIWESSQLYAYHTGESSWETIPVLRHLDKDGKELSRLDFPPDLAENLGLGHLRKFFVDGDEAIFAQCDDGFAMLNQDGNCVFSLVPDGIDLSTYGVIAVLGNGQIGVLFSEYNFSEGAYINTLRTIDKDMQDWGVSFRLNGSDQAVIFSGDESALFYYRTGDTLCVWRESAEEGEQVLNLLDADVNSYEVRAVYAQPSGQLALLTIPELISAPSDACVVKLAPVEASQLEKDVLTFASIGMSGKMRQHILEFNQTSSEYRISVTDYSQYGSYDAAMMRLVTEIGAGKMPDLLATYDLPITQWVEKGVLENLNPYLENDPDVNREMLMHRVLEASEIDGKLYEVGSSFWVSTLIGAKSVVGDRITWTGQDMQAALRTMPEGCIPFPYSKKTELLDEMILWPQLVDWENSLCHFDNEAFRSLLEFCASMPNDTVQSGYNENKALLDKQQMLIRHAITGFGSLVQAETLLGGKISYIGYPNPWGEVGSRFYMAEGVAMSSACKEKAGAWSFLRTLLLPHEENLDLSSSFSGFPINKADFMRAAEAALSEPEYMKDEYGEYLLDANGQKILESCISIRIDDSTWIDMPPTLSQDSYQQFMALYNSISSSNRTDPNLSAIVAEEAGAYFAEDKTLDQTIDMIQNRSSLYIEEQS